MKRVVLWVAAGLSFAAIRPGVGAPAVSSAVYSPTAAMIRDSYHHKAWTAKDGAPPGIWTINQTKDGWLWLGSASGLYRFDGVSFERVGLLPLKSVESRSVRALLATADGGLWVIFATGRVARIGPADWKKPGWLTAVPPGERIDGMREDGSRTTWAFTASSHAYLVHGLELHSVPATWNFPTGGLQSIVVDLAGNLWVTTSAELAVRYNATQVFERPTTNWPKGAALSISQSGQLWFSDAKGYQLLIYPDGTSAIPAGGRIRADTEGAAVFTGEGSWWSVDCLAGICRAWPSSAHQLLAGTAFRNDGFTHGDGLSSDRAMILFEDQEGDIWVGTKQGLDQFRKNEFTNVRFPQPLSYFTMVADSESGIWCGTAADVDARQDRLWKIDTYPRPLPNFTAPLSAAFQESDGSALLGGRGDIWKLSKGRIERQTGSPISSQSNIRTIGRDDAGYIWASFMGQHTFKLSAGAWSPNGGLPRFHDAMATAMTQDADGKLWIGFSDNTLTTMQGNHVSNFTQADGVSVGPVTAMSLGKQMLIGGEFGIEIFKNGRLVPLHTDAREALGGISGIAQTRQGSLWLFGAGGAEQIDAAEYGRGVAEPSYRMHSRLFDAEDGLPAGAQQAVGAPSIVEDKQGRLWFATAEGLVWMKPREQSLPGRSPTVEILGLSVIDRAYPANQGVQLPSGSRDVTFRYTALSLRMPSRVQFRFRLTGVDKDWRAMGTARQATYSNLGAGHYRVDVLAANESGVWSGEGAALLFSIEAAFYETPWFKAVSAATALLALFLLIRFQIRRATAKASSKMSDRLRERERIARELHDTLLQDVQALGLNLQALQFKYGDANPAKVELLELEAAAQRSLAEARARVTGLRAGRDGSNLQAEFQAFGEQLAALYPARVKIEVSGVPRPLHPVAADEVVAIGRESLLNAFRHAQAKTVSVSICYRSRALELVVSDDGNGFSIEETIQAEAPGHFGLRGMRERARAVKGRVDIQTRHGAGTSVSLIVPAATAFARKQSWDGSSISGIPRRGEPKSPAMRDAHSPADD